ncbi:hypothetical protein GCM10011409_16560 [Lentibacillus populi]|uniref:Uncharacterized protein n=1 Tax=Lentibacillus populi TaxID=1827502 RepID=A0A9W5TWS3_9BACI|nr:MULTISPECIES: hypothetical protein [Bacillaceae]GGB39743.1 hypothetical protein GCM10011409_16560 [Lentibacillus populi]
MWLNIVMNGTAKLRGKGKLNVSCAFDLVERWKGLFSEQTQHFISDKVNFIQWGITSR